MLINTDTTCFIFMQIHIDKDMIKTDSTCLYSVYIMKNRLLLYVTVCNDCFCMYLALSCQESHVSNVKIILD
jgi:hypothetical protein